MRVKTVDELAARVEGLSPADQLRLAAECLENRMPRLAKTIVEKVAAELEMLDAHGLLEEKPR